MSTTRSIICNADEVQGILDGRLTELWRLMEPQPPAHIRNIVCDWMDCDVEPYRQRYGYWDDEQDFPCPYGGPGDRLWVRETWRPVGPWETRRETVQYRADGACLRKTAPNSFRVRTNDRRDKWRSSTQMSRWASRLTLVVTGVRGKQMQEVTTDEAVAAGVVLTPDTLFPRINTPDKQLEQFPRLWNSHNPQHGFDTNPAAWVLGVKPYVAPPED